MLRIQTLISKPENESGRLASPVITLTDYQVSCLVLTFLRLTMYIPEGETLLLGIKALEFTFL